MELVQRQTQQLTQQTLQSLALLQMSTVELEAYVQELAQENPIIDLEPPRSEQEAPRDQELFRRVKWLEDSDRQNRYYQRLDAEELDPLAQVGTDGGLEESLSNFLFRQIQQLDLDESAKQLLRYLSACLDEDGYFRIPLDELSRTSGISQRRLARTLELLRSLEPAGVGASSLSQCLELQLLRIHEEGPALAIVRDCLEELAKKHYHAISARLSISQEEVRSAERLIRELNPRPGSIFALPSEISYIQPDILIEEIDGHFTARLRNSDRPYFQINSYYRSLLTQSDDAQVREYLTLKLRQAENVLWAIGQRETTLLRCAQAIAGRQQDFFQFHQIVAIHRSQIDEAEILEDRCRLQQYVPYNALGILDDFRHRRTDHRGAVQAAFHRLFGADVSFTAPHGGQVACQCPHVFGNGHLIVIEDHNEIIPRFSGIVQSFIGQPAGHGSVPYNGNGKMLLVPVQPHALCNAACHGDRSAAVPADEAVVF